MEDNGSIIERNRFNGQVFNKAQIFYILDSAASNKVLALHFGVSHMTISKIRNNRIYKNWVEEYHKANAAEIASQLETLSDKFPRIRVHHHHFNFTIVPVLDVFRSL